jgi:hypothetical protein
MPTHLHSSQGLKIVKNPRNGFTVATLHYMADPRKRSKEWRREAARGMTQAKFEQEFEISYDAMLGEKVFPEIKARQTEIILHEGPYQFNDWPHDLPMYAGLDYGARNTSSFHIYAAVDGVLYAIWELYEPCKNIIEFVEKLKACPYWSQLRYIAYDPSMDNRTQRDMSTGAMVTVVSQFIQLGCTRLLKGNSDEQAWLTQMQRHWCGDEITFKIMDCCPKLIEEFEAATYVSMSERQLETSNFREQLVDKFNHALDDCKYFMNSSPSLKSRKITLPNLAAKFGFGPVSGIPAPRTSRNNEWTFLR